MNDLITKIEQMQAEARDGMKRASRDSDPYLYQYLVGKFHAFGKVAGILKKQKEPHYTKRNALFDKCVENCDPEIMKRVSDEVDEMLEKEQKPAEWSEEDEEVMEDLYNFVISDFIQDHIHETRWKPWKTTLERNRQNRLKSIRPVSKESLQSWKPSEEQLTTLLRAEGISRASGYPDNAKVLASLYEQLKKLLYEIH